MTRAMSLLMFAAFAWSCQPGSEPGSEYMPDMARGKAYLTEYPGFGGWLLFWACSGSVVLAGAKILDALRYERQQQR